MRSVTPLLIALIFAGCASKSADVAPTYVSPVMYQNFTCQQIAQEAQNISAHAAEMAGAHDQKRSNDQIATGVAIVVFWPAAFFVGGDGNTAAELARSDAGPGASLSTKELRHSIQTSAPIAVKRMISA